jgi:glycerate dehydrogenase
MRGCILDRRSFDLGDIDMNPLLQQLDGWSHYPSSRHEQAAERIAGCTVVVTNKVRLDRETIRGCDTLKLVMLAATGTDNVDLEACHEHGVVVCNARRYSRPAVVQHTFALILGLVTNLLAYNRDVRKGAWSRSDVFCLLDHPVRELEGKTLGIVGLGDLGSRVADIGRAFGMPVIVSARPGSEPGDARLPMDEFLESADVISLHCPLTRETRHLFSVQQFARMRNDAIIINTARGAIIDPVALAWALREGQIGGAGIDVLEEEPPAPDHPLLATDIPNLIVTPHNAWGTRESRQRLVGQISENLAAWRAGTPCNVVT